ncbi:MAG: ATP-binding protein, partial [Bacteroidota bacterium]|nr:ATP-binding protein [Bacteroidota bacterium]
RVLLNLIDNAVKYNVEGGDVMLSLTASEGFACIRVRDTGIGIAPEALPRIFERFYRVDRQHEKSMSGTGLGLSIVQWIVETHGGDITAESKSGEGSLFTIRLPLEAPETA